MNIKLSDILPPPKDYNYDPDEFKRLKDSIKINGLFHPIIIQGDEPPYKIIAGRARFLAMTELWDKPRIVETNDSLPTFYIPSDFMPGEIPAIIFPESCQNPHEIALHENLRRKNLSWYELVEYEQELHELRVKEHGQRPEGRPKTVQGMNGNWSLRDTAKELGLALGGLSQDIQLANTLKANPHLRNVKDKTTALKLVKQIARREEILIEQAFPSDIEMDQVFLGDSYDILKTFPNETFDVCLTDPPWSEYKDENLRSPQDKLLPIFMELFRCLKRDAFLYLVTSTTDFYFYGNELPKLGFRIQNYPLIWQKPKTITHGRSPWQYARDYEPIIVAVKGDPILIPAVELSSILKYDNVHYSKMIHPHEKPIELINCLLFHCSNPGAKIVDPFAGSGVVLEACKKSDRRYIGIEKDKKFFENIERRLKQ
jgi:DNA modification methylase